MAVETAPGTREATEAPELSTTASTLDTPRTCTRAIRHGVAIFLMDCSLMRLRDILAAIAVEMLRHIANTTSLLGGKGYEASC